MEIYDRFIFAVDGGINWRIDGKSEEQKLKHHYKLKIAIMKKVSLLVVVICMMACKPEIKTLPLNEFEASVQQSNAVLLDVRTWDEYASGHIANAINVDWKSDNFEQQFAELGLDKNQAIAVYCLHAKRSQNAAECIIDMGYPNVFQLEEGIEPWTELELVKEFANKDLIGVWQVCKVDSIDELIIDKICRSVGEAIPPTNRPYRPRVIFQVDRYNMFNRSVPTIC